MLNVSGKQVPEGSIAGEDLPPNRFVTVKEDGRVYLAQSKNEVWSISTNHTNAGEVARVANVTAMYKVMTKDTVLPEVVN